MTETKKDTKGTIQLPAAGLKVKIDSKANPNMPYIKADLFQASRIGEDFTIVVHQSNYQVLVEELQAGHLEIPEGGTIVIGKFVMNNEGFIRMKTQIDEIYDKWQAQLQTKSVQ